MSSFKDRFDKFFDFWKRDYLHASRQIIWTTIAIAAVMAFIAAANFYSTHQDLDFDLVMPTLNWFLISLLFLVIIDFIFGMPLLARDFIREIQGGNLSRHNVAVLRNELLTKFIHIGGYRGIWFFIAMICIGLSLVTREGLIITFLILLYYIWMLCASSGLLAASFFRYPLASILVLILWLLPGLVFVSMIVISQDQASNFLYDLQFRLFLILHHSPGVHTGSLYYFFNVIHPPRSYNLNWVQAAIYYANLMSLISIFAAYTIMNIRFPERKKLQTN